MMQMGHRASWQKKADPRSLHSGPCPLLLPHGAIPGEAKVGEEHRTGCEPAAGLQSRHGERMGPASVHTGQVTEKVWLQEKEPG